MENSWNKCAPIFNSSWTGPKNLHIACLEPSYSLLVCLLNKRQWLIFIFKKNTLHSCCVLPWCFRLNTAAACPLSPKALAECKTPINSLFQQTFSIMMQSIHVPSEDRTKHKTIWKQWNREMCQHQRHEEVVKSPAHNNNWDSKTKYYRCAKIKK